MTSFDIDLAEFAANPYPALADMQRDGGIHHVPQLNATLLTRRNDIFECEKNVAVFSSRQPHGLMDQLMGQNMMRKDGAAHMAERRATFPALSPRTVRDTWLGAFRTHATDLLSTLRPLGKADLVADFALPLSGHALRHITGLLSMTPQDIDAGSQGMIDGIANYGGDPDIEARCHAATAMIDAHLTRRLAELHGTPDLSLIGVQLAAGVPEAAIRANVKLAISGGQNEPRDAIAGTIWALLTHPGQLALITAGQATWQQAFEEYARWISPIGMSPRRIAQPFALRSYEFEPESRAFFMFSAANRDPVHFDRPDAFDLTRDTRPAIAFGAGPHFCAGAAASRALIAQVALPMVFEALPNLRLADGFEPGFVGWAFRGPQRMLCEWDTD